MLMSLINNSKFKIQSCSSHLANASGAVLLTVVMIILIIGMAGVAIYSLTSTSTYTQLNAQNASKAFYLAESGFRVVASEYNNADETPPGNKNSILENLHGTSLSLPDDAGQFDMRLYPYWFYTSSAYTANTTNINVKIPGGSPLRDPEVTGSAIIRLPDSGYLKLQGKSQLATITSVTPFQPPDSTNINIGINPGFPYDIQTDEEIFLVYSDNTTITQVVTQDGSLDLPGLNPIAQILPARNGSFRAYNETNDKMDYTYRERTPPVIDPGNPPTTITLTGIQHQDEDRPSVFPFTVDSASEIYFGRNLAVFSTSTVGSGGMAAQKTIGNYTDVGLDSGFSTGKDTISFEEDIADFSPTMNDPDPSVGTPIEVINTTDEKVIKLGGNLPDGYGSVWYKGDTDIANCIEGECLLGKGIRVWFEFEFDDTDTAVDSKDFGDGFSFSLVSGANYTDGDTGLDGEYMGYAGAGLASEGLQSPKIGIEIDTYPNPGVGNMCDGDSRRDDTPVANHLAAVYWGEETPGSFDAMGGWISLGAEDWSSNTDTCGSGDYCGTLSFWFKRDTENYGDETSGDRLWGQHTNMEIYFSSDGSDLLLDWGDTESLTMPNPFTQLGKWYFVHISWREGHRLRFSWGDKDGFDNWDYWKKDPWNPPTWPAGVTENLIMNSSGGDENQNFQVDGQGADLRFYKAEVHTEFDVRRIWNNTRPTAPDSYHPLQADTIDSSTGVSASIVGSAGWSADTPSLFDCGTNADTYDDNRHGTGGITTPMNSLNSDNTNGNDGYHQVTGSSPNWLEDGLPHLFRIELIRPLLPSIDGVFGGTNYEYQMKIWVD